MRTPPNPPAKKLFRVLLWFLPSGFAVLAGVGGDLLLRNHFPKVLCDVIPLLLISAFTVGTGWYNSFLSEHAHTEHFGTIYRTAKFFCLQLIIIPILGSLLFFLLIISGLIPV